MGKPEAEARRVLERFEIASPPVPVDRIAVDLGAQIVDERMDRRMSGLLYREADRVLIGVNEAHAPVRRRFTIAHEIGHLLLHPGKQVFLDERVNFRDETSSLAVDREEIQANAFAAELLMPSDLVLEECRRASTAGTLTRAGFVSDLASIFDVSDEAMSHRLTNLGIRSQV